VGPARPREGWRRQCAPALERVRDGDGQASPGLLVGRPQGPALPRGEVGPRSRGGRPSRPADRRRRCRGRQVPAALGTSYQRCPPSRRRRRDVAWVVALARAPSWGAASNDVGAVGRQR
jgi:hypothetical protein